MDTSAEMYLQIKMKTGIMQLNCVGFYHICFKKINITFTG